MFFNHPMATRNLDIQETIKSLKRRIRAERDSNVRDRLRIILLAAKRYTNVRIGERLGYSSYWVQKWIARYKRHGIDGLQDAPRSGQPPLLTQEQTSILYNQILAGPDSKGTLSRYRIVDVQEWIKKHFKVNFSLSGTHSLMKRMKLSHLRPRPTHPAKDPKAVATWKKKLLKS